MEMRVTEYQSRCWHCGKYQTQEEQDKCEEVAKEPKCPKCGKDMKPIYDPITEKISEYSWACECNPDMILSIG